MEPIKVLSPQELKNISDSFLEEYLSGLQEFMLEGMEPDDLEQYRQAVKDARAESNTRREAREAEEERLRQEKEAEEEKKKQEQANSPSANGWERDTYIDTTYGLQTLQEDQSKRGTGFLVIAAMLTVFYLAFGIPYWMQIIGNHAPVNELLGEELALNVVVMHLGLAGLAFLLNFIAIFSGKSLIALTAAVLYALAILPAPTYVIYVGLQSLFCIFGGLKKQTMKKPVRFFRTAATLLSLAIVAVTGLVRFDLIASADIPYMDQVLAYIADLGSSFNPETEAETEDWDAWNEDWEVDEEDWDDEDWEDESDWDTDDGDEWDGLTVINEEEFNALDDGDIVSDEEDWEDESDDLSGFADWEAGDWNEGEEGGIAPDEVNEAPISGTGRTHTNDLNVKPGLFKYTP